MKNCVETHYFLSFINLFLVAKYFPFIPFSFQVEIPHMLYGEKLTVQMMGVGQVAAQIIGTPKE